MSCKNCAFHGFFLTPDISLLQAHAYLCGGLFKLLVAGRQEGKVPAPEPHFDKEQVRYEHRFGAFVSLMTPPLAPYSQYKVSNEYLYSVLLRILIFSVARSRSRKLMRFRLQPEQRRLRPSRLSKITLRSNDFCQLPYFFLQPLNSSKSNGHTDFQISNL
jgi:hypothetical protein